MLNQPTEQKVQNTKTRVEHILEPFGAKHASGLINFFDKISSEDVDIVLFMARKSLCIYRMMELCGIKRIEAQVVSDALLDSDPKIFEAKRILVVDDTLFVGTTLSDAKLRLEKSKPASLSFWVYCVDGCTWSQDTFKPDYIHSVLDEQETIEFCSAECRAMINAGIPYLTDFAASRRIRLFPRQLERAIKTIDWVFHNVSSQYHEKHKIKYYSALPDNYINQVVKRNIGEQIFNLIEIAKIRVFAAWTGSTHEVTFVPVIAFSPTNTRSLRYALKAICNLCKMDYDRLSASSIRGKMRLLQYVIGAIFMQTYWESIDDIIPININSKFSFDWCSTVFSPSHSVEISQAIARIYQGELSEAVFEQPLPELVISEPPEPQKETKDDIDDFIEKYFSGDSGLNFGHTFLSDLTAIFTEFQTRFETVARKEITNKDKNPRFRNRLKRGFAWHKLCSYFLSEYRKKNNRENRNVISLFLDRLIDFGIAVPIITTTSENVIYRAYRYGEDVKFGNQEESLIYELLNGFESARGVEGIEATYLEKLIVILLRVGMEEEWLTLWYSHSGHDNLARIGYHLQGAVPILTRREDGLVPESECSWLSRRLVETGVLFQENHGNRPGKMYQLGEKPQAAHTRSDALRAARGLGVALGKACVSKAQPRSPDRPLATEDLIVLTSCANEVDITGAVVAELRLFSDWYNQKAFRILKGDFSNPQSQAFKIPVKGSKGAQAVNSACWKLNKFENKEVDKIFEKVSSLAKRDNEWVSREQFWEAIFKAFTRSPDSNDRKKMTQIRKASAQLLICFDFLLKCLGFLVRLARNLEPKDISEFARDITAVQLPKVESTPDFLGWAESLTRPQQSHSQIRVALGKIAAELNTYAKSLCDMAYGEASSAEKLILMTGKKLTRIQYSYMIWYDIVDVRVRRQGTPDATKRYSKNIDSFRADVNSMLRKAQEHFREFKGDLFSDTGDLDSCNDSKHIFLNKPGGSIDDGNKLLCHIIRIAQATGVKLRLMATRTDLRGEYVYLNRGSTSIDGDFKSHLHTIIQEIEHHPEENELRNGECIVWFLKKEIDNFKSYGSLNFTKHKEENEVSVEINIRGFRENNVVNFIRSTND